MVISTEGENSDYNQRVTLTVGRVAIEWARLEASCQQAVGEIADLNFELGPTFVQVGRALTAGRPILDIWPMTEALLARSPEELKWFNAWKNEANSLRIRRNRAVHSTWGYNLESKHLQGMDLTGRRSRVLPEMDVFPGGPSELEALVNAIVESRGKLDRWVFDTFTWPRALKRQAQESGADDNAAPAS